MTFGILHAHAYFSVILKYYSHFTVVDLVKCPPYKIPVINISNCYKIQLQGKFIITSIELQLIFVEIGIVFYHNHSFVNCDQEHR